MGLKIIRPQGPRAGKIFGQTDWTTSLQESQHMAIRPDQNSWCDLFLCHKRYTNRPVSSWAEFRLFPLDHSHIILILSSKISKQKPIALRIKTMDWAHFRQLIESLPTDLPLRTAEDINVGVEILTYVIQNAAWQSTSEPIAKFKKQKLCSCA